MLSRRQGRKISVSFNHNIAYLLLQNMALSSFQLFVGQIQTAPEELRVKVLKIIFDLLVIYGEEFFDRSDEIVSHFVNRHDCLT